MIIINSILLGIFGIAAHQDIKEKKIALYLIIIGGVAAIFYRLLYGKTNLLTLIIDLLPSLCIWLIAIFGRQIIGYGDAAIFTVSALVLGLFGVINLIILSMVINAIYGGVLLICRKKKPKDTIAFVPSIFLAYLVIFILKIYGN